MTITVLSPPSSSALSTLASVKQELNITSSDDDRYFMSLIDRASAVIASHIGRPLGKQTVSETITPFHRHRHHHNPWSALFWGRDFREGDRPVILSYTPVTSIGSVVEDSNFLYSRDMVISATASTTANAQTGSLTAPTLDFTALGFKTGDAVTMSGWSDAPISSTTPQTIVGGGITTGTAAEFSSITTIVSYTDPGHGIRPTNVVLNTEYTVINRGTNNLLLYPPTGAQWDSTGTDIPATIGANFGSGKFVLTSSTQGYVY